MTDTDEPRFRIGEVAQQAGVSTRTLRYYQELGMLAPGVSPGGSRRYTQKDVGRLRRILELRDVMGFDLDRISAILHAEDRLAELREEVLAGVSLERRQDVVREAIALNNSMRAQVHEKLDVLQSFLDELETKAARYRQIAFELHVDVPEEVGAEVAGG
ncbi:MAG TPA: MerR family transcriptional regulator [Acidimicrobiales bacterium]|nr:MerR family transcriptional regulator [Acidimicrobiales bacterium]